MKNLYPIYHDIKDWEVLETITVHDFSCPPKPIVAVKVLIGILIDENIDINQHYLANKTPIIRWLSQDQYLYLKEHEGTVIW